MSTNLKDALRAGVVAMIQANPRFDGVRVQERIRGSRFGTGQRDRAQFDKSLIPVVFIESSEQKDGWMGIQYTFNGIVFRQYQIYAIAGFNKQMWGSDRCPNFDDKSEVQGELIATLRARTGRVNTGGSVGHVTIPNVPQIWYVDVKPTSTYDMSALDSDYDWTSAEAWYVSKEFATAGNP
jgi:hypothetical protein